jgi:hypothetical protein
LHKRPSSLIQSKNRDKKERQNRFASTKSVSFLFLFAQIRINQRPKKAFLAPANAAAQKKRGEK